MSHIAWAIIGLAGFFGFFWLTYRVLQKLQAGDRRYDNDRDYPIYPPG